MSDGYFALEQETKATFIEENGIRWWRSGDIAEIDEFGHLSIVDRKKDLVKLQCGKFIALGRVRESIRKVLRFSDLVSTLHQVALSSKPTSPNSNLLFPHRSQSARPF